MRAMGEELRLVKEELTSTKLLKEKYEELIVGQLARNSHSNTTISQNKSQMSGKDISLLSLKDRSPIMHK